MGAKSLLHGLIIILLMAQSAFCLDCRLRFRYLTSENGLSSGRVLSIAQDSRGFIWVGTAYGLNRYDGYAFKNYTPSVDALDAPGALPTRLEFKAIAADRGGRVWVRAGETRSHLCLYDPTTDKFITFVGEKANDDIGAVAEDKSGRLWVSTRIGLSRLDTETGKAVNFPCGERLRAALGAEGRLEKLAIDFRNRLWASACKDVLRFELDGFDSERFVRYTHDPVRPGSLSEGNLVRCLLANRRDRVWIGTDYGGLSQYDLASNSFLHNRQDADLPWSLSSDFIWALCEDGQGILRVWVEDNGLDVGADLLEKPGHGLANMRERLAGVGGRCMWTKRSPPGFAVEL